jgi:hypothetical protein
MRCLLGIHSWVVTEGYHLMQGYRTCDRCGKNQMWETDGAPTFINRWRDCGIKIVKKG